MQHEEKFSHFSVSMQILSYTLNVTQHFVCYWYQYQLRPIRDLIVTELLYRSSEWLNTYSIICHLHCFSKIKSRLSSVGALATLRVAIKCACVCVCIAYTSVLICVRIVNVPDKRMSLQLLYFELVNRLLFNVGRSHCVMHVI